MQRREHIPGIVIGFVVLVVTAALFLDAVSLHRPRYDWAFAIVGALGAVLGVGSLVEFLKPAASRRDPKTGRPLDLDEYENYERAIVESSTTFPRPDGGTIAVPGQPEGYTHRLACGHFAICTTHRMGRIFCDACYQAAERARLRQEGAGDAS